MEARIYRSTDHAELDRLVESFRPCLFNDEQGRCIGIVVRVWRDGDFVMAEIEDADAPALVEAKP